MNRLAVSRSARAQQAHKVSTRINQLIPVDNVHLNKQDGKKPLNTISAINSEAIFDAP